jgi:hypothetical protein
MNNITINRILITIYNWSLDIITAPLLYARAIKTEAEKPTKDMQQYLAIFKAAIPAVNYKEWEDGGVVKHAIISRHPNALQVYLEYSKEHDMVLLQIAGADSEYWLTAEDKDLDSYVQAAIAALQGTWTKRFGLHGWEICFKLPSSRWLCTRVIGSRGVHYITTRRWV